LMNGVGGQAPRRWPMWSHIASVRKLTWRGPRMLCQPCTNGNSSLVGVAWQ
jgi:hypothetical protein